MKVGLQTKGNSKNKIAYFDYLCRKLKTLCVASLWYQNQRHYGIRKKVDGFLYFFVHLTDWFKIIFFSTLFRSWSCFGWFWTTDQNLSDCINISDQLLSNCQNKSKEHLLVDIFRHQNLINKEGFNFVHWDWYAFFVSISGKHCKWRTYWP